MNTNKKKFELLRGDLIMIEKVAQVKNAVVETASVDEYVHGEYNDKTPYIGYTAKGILAFDVEEGSSIVLYRTERNSVPVLGTMRTSKVQEIEHHTPYNFTIHTENSTYEVTIVACGFSR